MVSTLSRLYLYQSSTLTARITLQRSNCIQEGAAISTPHILIHHQIPPPTPVGYCVLSILIFEDRRLSSCELHPLSAVSLIRNAGIHLTCQTWTTLRKPLIMSSCYSWTHDPGKGEGNWGGRGFSLSDIYCNLSPLGANVVMVDGQSHHPWRHPL